MTTTISTRRPGLLLALLAIILLAVPRPAAAAPVQPGGGWPLAGTPRVIRGFDPPAQVWGAGHRGVDLAARPGEQVLATGAGRVSFAGSVAGRGVLTIDHGGGLSTTYEPVRAQVAVGTVVAVGDVVAVVAAGSHCGGCLHWGLRDGTTYLDPLQLVRPGGGSLRLVSTDRRAEVQREAAARALAEAAARAAQTAVGVAGVADTPADTPAGPPGSHGFVRPVPGGITSPFGRRFHPVLHVWKLHDGTDFGAACGTAIHAPYAGRVTRAYFNTGYGNRLLIDHGTVDGRRVVTAMNHATRYVVGPGARVSRGQVVGYVGQTGYATGCHLHLMVWLDDGLVDPMSWL